MQQKTVIYIGSLDLPDGNAGANRAWVIGKLLRDCGYRVALIGADRDIASYKPILETRRVIEDFACYTNPRRDFLVSIRSITKVIEAIGAENVQAVIAVNYPAFPLNNLRRYCKSKRIDFLVDCTEWYRADRGNLAYRALKWLDIRLRMGTVHRKINHIICISRYLENHYRKLGCSTFYLPGIVDPQDPKWAVEPYPRSGITRRFIFAGKATNDRLDLLIAAFHEMMRQGYAFEFHIFGVTTDFFLALHPEHGEKLESLSRHVFFHGRIPHHDVIRHIKASDFSVFTRERTRAIEAGFPTKLIESFTCGVPPITNRTSDIGDFLEDGGNGFLIENYDLQEIKSALLRALDLTEPELERMKANCRRYDKSDYRRYIGAVGNYLRKLG